MERLFQDSAVPQIKDTGNVKLFPVRHHSPVCSYQLRRMIAEFEPECILIEGPENANHLISVLTDEYTTLPSAIYYFYKDKKKYISEDAESYQCYYPFLYSSPEYTAMMEAKKRNIPAKFIDLPYSEIMIHTDEEIGFRKSKERHSYADDTDLITSRFYQELCQKTNLRSFEEFWEKYFEIAGLRLTSEQFVRQMMTYCILTRDAENPERFQKDGTLAREQHMTYRIQEAQKKYTKILVVTGGFHSPAIAENLQKPVKPIKLHKFTEDMESCYPIAYSYEAMDALNGYASGMPHPAFYDGITQDLAQSDTPEGIYTAHCLDLLTRTAKESVKKDIPIAISDITSAWSLAQGLASLRESPETGFMEVWDGVTSSMIKGEKTTASALPLDILRKLAMGDGIGHIGNKEFIPPLIEDFESQCKTFRLKSDTVVPQEVEISLFAKESELAKSRFFHQMNFLDTNFADRKKGPDLHHNKDRSRVREVWRYCRTPAVDSALVDHTTDGSTFIEACRTVAEKRIQQERRTEVASQISVDCFLMGIPFAHPELMREILNNDGDFFSLGNGLYYFDMLRELRHLYGFEDTANEIYLVQCFTKLISLIPSMGMVQPEQAQDCIKICRLLYGVTGRLLTDRQDELKQAFITLTMLPQKEPSVYGAVMGLLYAMDGSYLQKAETAMQGYLKSSSDIRKQGALYLKGLFETARDIALTDTEFLNMTDELLQNMEYDDFMEILPSLRLAYSYFTPSEIQEIAQNVSSLHGMETDLFAKESVNEALTAFGAEIDAEIFRICGFRNHD